MPPIFFPHTTLTLHAHLSLTAGRACRPQSQGVVVVAGVEEQEGAKQQAVSLALRPHFVVRLHGGRVCLWRQVALGPQRHQTVRTAAILHLVRQAVPVPSGPLRHRARGWPGAA